MAMASNVIAMTTTVKILLLALSFIVPPPRGVSWDVDEVVPSNGGAEHHVEVKES